MTIGERIRCRRKELKLKMKDIFESENIKTGNLSELENDKYSPSVQTLISLSRVLDCSIDWILTGKEYHDHPEESLNLEILKSEQGLMCNGSPLSEMEADLVAMFRLLPAWHVEEIFDLVYFKYKRIVEQKKESIYSTYFDTNKQQKSDSENDQKSGHGIV